MIHESKLIFMNRRLVRLVRIDTPSSRFSSPKMVKKYVSLMTFMDKQQEERAFYRLNHQIILIRRYKIFKSCRDTTKDD